MKVKSPLKQSLQLSIGIAIGTFLYALFLSDEQVVDFYRPLFIGLISFIVLFAYLKIVKHTKSGS